MRQVKIIVEKHPDGYVKCSPQIGPVIKFIKIQKEVYYGYRIAV